MFNYTEMMLRERNKAIKQKYLNKGRKEGRKEGWKEGYEEGLKEGRETIFRLVIKNMLEKGFDGSKIMDILELTSDEYTSLGGA